MAKKKSTNPVYVVLCGTLDEEPEAVRVLGVYSTKKAAYAARDAEYKSSVYDEEDDDEDADLSSSYVDNGQEFWSVEERPLL